MCLLSIFTIINVSTKNNGGNLLKRVLEKTFKVAEDQTAVKVGSGDLEVLSTPILIAFMENTALSLVSDSLEEGNTTVGIEMNVKHQAPSAVGDKILVEAKLIEQKKTILSFEIEAQNEDGVTIAIGDHKRAVVNATAFMKNV